MYGEHCCNIEASSEGDRECCGDTVGIRHIGYCTWLLVGRMRMDEQKLTIGKWLPSKDAMIKVRDMRIAELEVDLANCSTGRATMVKLGELGWEPEVNLHNTTDAQVWAKEFVRLKHKNNWTVDDIDEGLMIGWFANAFCTQEAFSNGLPDENAGQHIPTGKPTADEQALLAAFPNGMPEEPQGDLQTLVGAVGKWSDATFGYGRSCHGCLHHLKKEIDEVLADPKDPIEWFDCLSLLLDGARMAGFGVADLVKVGWKKLEINKSRLWAIAGGENGVIEHLRQGDSPNSITTEDEKALLAKRDALR